MATVKNYGLAGVSDDVQFGKSGGRLTYDGTAFNVRNSTDSAYIQLNIPLTPTLDQHATSKQYVDSVATGLNVKESVRTATVAADIAQFETDFTYNNAADDNSSETPLVWTGTQTSVVFDGITLADGDRVLIDEATDQRGNGVFTFVSGSGFRRATDADNTPGNEVAGGMLVPVLEGVTHGADQHILVEPTGVATLGTDNLVFSVFSSAQQLVGGDGIDITGLTVSANTTGSSTGIASDDIIVRSTSTAGQVLRSNGNDGEEATWGALDLANSSAVTGTLDETNGGTGLASIPVRSILATNTSADTLTTVQSPDGSGDQILIWNDSADAFTFVAASTLGTSYGQITGGDGGTAAADSSNEVITFNGNGINIQAADAGTGSDTVSFTLAIDDLVTGTDTLVATDTIAVYDGTDTLEYTFNDVMDDLDIVNLGAFSSAHLISRSADDTYQEVTFAASTVAGDEGISIVNGNGASAGTIDIGLDIDGLTLATVINSTDKLVVFDGTNNVKVNASELIADNVLSFTTIVADGGTNPVADSSSDTLNLVGATNGGIVTNGTAATDTIDFALDVNDLTTGAETLVLTDTIAVYDGTDTLKYAFSDIVQDLSIPNGATGNGFIVRDGANSYRSATLTADADAGFEGISVQNGLGAADPEIGLDIDNLVLQTTVAGTDEIVVFNGTNNVKTTVAGLVSGGTVAWTSLSGDAGAGATADSSSDTITFSGQSGTTLGVGGITVTVNDDPEQVFLDLDINNVAATTPTIVEGTDALLLDDGGATTRVTVEHFVQDLDIPYNITGNGFITRTADDTYAQRTIVASGTAGLEGIDLVNGAGSAGNPSVGLDITNLTPDTTITGSYELVAYNGSNNVKITIDELLADVDGASISEGNSSVTVSDTGTGSVVVAVDGSTTTTFGPSSTTSTVPFLLPDGTETAPALAFADDTDTGIYSPTDGTLCVTADGKDVACFRIESGATGDEHIVFEASDGETRMVAEGDDTNIDIRLVPAGTGSVYLGDPGTAATIATSDGSSSDGEDLTIQTGNGGGTGAAGGDITINAGDSGTTGAGGGITITPGSGTTTDGNVCITDDDGVNVTCFEGVDSAVNYLTVTNAATAGDPSIAATGTDSNIDINFLPVGTGVLNVSGTTDYEDNVTDDDDIPNKAYVDAQIAGGTVSGSVSSYLSTVDETGALATTINIPANADITRVVVNVTTAYNGAADFDIGTAAGNTRVAAAGDNAVDWQTVGTYIIEHFESFTGAASDFQFTLDSGSATLGAATVRVEYINA